MRVNGEPLAQITDLADAGVIEPVVGKVVAFDEIPQAVELLELGGIRDKAVAAVET